MSSSDSSELSPSPSASPEASYHEPGLEQLVIHFVSAKKALTSTQHVVRATELVTSSRTLIEDIAATSAKNAFAVRSVEEQVDILHAIRDGVSDSTVEANTEFEAIITGLDAANDRLQGTLASLKRIVVDSSLQRRDTGFHESADEDVNSVETETPKTLFDFVDESSYDDLRTALRTLIDSFNDSRADLDNTLNRFHDSISAITQSLTTTSIQSLPAKGTIYDEAQQPLGDLFKMIEDHAGEMASLLQSLITHYDLCVTALKHTEGGREAARQAVLARGGDLKVDGSLYGADDAEPISNEERTRLLMVLEGDAVEVEDVANEVRERGIRIEELYDTLDRQSIVTKTTARRLKKTLGLLCGIRASLPVYLDASTQFRNSWVTIQSAIQDKTQELVGLRGFYEHFLSSYDKLLGEIERRRMAETQMRKVADKARRELDKLHQSDRKARDEFIDDVGGFLPGDLWPGLADQGVKWEVRSTLQGQEDPDA